MRRRRAIYRRLSIVVIGRRSSAVQKVTTILMLLSLLFQWTLPLVGAAPTAHSTISSPQEVTAPVAPSEQATDWPMPELPANEPFSPFLNPTSLALAEAVRGGIEPELIGNRGGLEPLESLGGPGSHLSPFHDKLTLPDSSLLSPANPLDNITPTLPGPSDLAVLAKQDEPDEAVLPFDEGAEGDVEADAATPIETKTVVDEDTAATDLLDWSVTKPGNAAIKSETSPIPEGKPLARAATVSGTVVTETTDLENDHLIFLPLILRNSSVRAYPNNPAARKAMRAQAKCRKAM